MNKEYITKASKEKAKFRATSVWKKFRELLKKERKVDFITKKPLREGFQVHHCDLNENHYKDLNPLNFITVNRNSHKIIHEIYRYDWKMILDNLRIVFEKMDELNKEVR